MFYKLYSDIYVHIFVFELHINPFANNNNNNNNNL